ncbi:prepilin-type N-terminal cleavage/methylation domain-containing protein [Candidatus Accumulibacter vicinus]|uniref:PilD-dependent protein PddA n=1 Tax=Candidatus Accumulibacter vicinus TaxID=2954382 RepID=A0A084Y4V8_9PROT|nr:prepilin-type N-terminal cleavage/methylation domain-containing protein [Candidatus Accumulibacter vicinus]KFB69752.1 MAG: PilD-dependent protein PddA [Candidatus Accumulibacter vicinus]
MVKNGGRQRRGHRTNLCGPSRYRIGRGFTLIELLVVLSIIALLLTLAVPRYFHSIDISKEAVLSENLHIVRETIDKFYGDKGRYPESLEELVSEKYLRALPHDPVTGSAGTWTIVAPDEAGAKGNVYDIKSGAPGTTRDGKPFADL